MADPHGDLLLAVAAFCRSFGFTARRIVIYVEGQDFPFELHVPLKYLVEHPQQRQAASVPPPQAPPPPPPPSPPVEEDSAAVRERIACTVEIIDMLRAKRFPLTETRLLFEFSRAGKKWRLGLVVKCLRDMVADGTVENPPEAKPRGYRLPEGSTEEPPEESGE